MKFYGNEIETFVVTGKGNTYLIQNPDMAGEYEDHTKHGLPGNVQELDPALCEDLVIPDFIQQEG